MNTFDNQLVSAFKIFIKEEKKLTLDFRHHVFLENQYGAYPSYSYSDAEAVVDSMFEFFDKYHVEYAGRYNRSMSIESLRTQKLKHFLLVHLSEEIDESVFHAVNAETAPDCQILKAFISSSASNPCLCIDVNDEIKAFIIERLGIAEEGGGEGCDGFINVQYPVTSESQLYIARSNFVDDIWSYSEDYLICELMDGIITEANRTVSRRDYELECKFGTSNITAYDNMVQHGYYNNLSLALLENNETLQAYVTFERVVGSGPVHFPVNHKTFDSLDDAEAYIKGHIVNHQTVQDFGISHDIYNELESSLD